MNVVIRVLFLWQIVTSAPATPAEPMKYVCRNAKSAVVLDGKADEVAWQSAEWTSYFIDIEGDAKPAPRFKTRAKMAWDDVNLYVYADMDEPHVWGTLKNRNAIIYNDNDFEIFIDPDGDTLNYYEFEMNALGTMMELVLDKPYIRGGSYRFLTNAGVKSAVHVDGTLNDASDVDRGWSVEIAIPWEVLKLHHTEGVSPPRPGDVWRVNFSRVEWTHEIAGGQYRKVPKETKAEDNWVWSPMGVVDMHRPERWGKVEFAE